MAISPQTRKIVQDVALFAVSQVLFYAAFKAVMSSMDPQSSKRKEAKDKSKKALSKLGLDLSTLDLTEHEEIIAGEVVHPSEINVTFKDIGGLEPIISQLREAVIFPLCYPQVFESAAGLFGPPKGVLLYGPPGCGKTMLAKALAKESGATFINMHVSTLTDKWFGESNKLVAALFSLAKKLQPSIIFIDEIDSFMRERRSSDHEVTGMMKAEFMRYDLGSHCRRRTVVLATDSVKYCSPLYSMWDGLATGNDTRILVLGATNRPNDIDAAILRRMPKRFSIKLPDFQQRRNILTLMLRDIKLDPSFSMDSLVRRTDGLSGSDLKEACRNAAMVPVRDHMRSHSVGGQVDLEKIKQGNFKIRPLLNGDFLQPDQPANGRYATESEGLD
ncbi:BZ3500_MvSof-1268-A1-R1_Chr10-1g02628 [Microbotryum saponariae]|uniref:BZ3500_MvSof-1268-A1-R1_Chr10-1g02628 protein n=1 Tax=Microbotryum saponariae TaxID=289078 RepID=A0A2X0NKQ4_9BASI|nr:BZ3500_MvSof-1268-A1-R1_Chr10-1g02628 [Microbotryum saponariae]SDA06117.1 BZ3501_MvSof-1269-A2-R1_Chr10-1g02229 [Microbotryum saponariae]